jgi:hypothetical protein
MGGRGAWGTRSGNEHTCAHAGGGGGGGGGGVGRRGGVGGGGGGERIQWGGYEWVRFAPAGGGGSGGFGGGGGHGGGFWHDDPLLPELGGPGGHGGFGGGGGGGGAGAYASGGTRGMGGFGGGDGGDGIGGAIKLWGQGGGGGGMGGAIFAHGATVRVIDSVFRNNVARGGAGGEGAQYSEGGTGGSGFGGAIFALNADVTLEHLTFVDNAVVPGAGSTAGGAAGSATYAHFQNDGVGNTVFQATTSTIVLRNSLVVGPAGACVASQVDGTLGCDGASLASLGLGADLAPLAGSPAIDAGAERDGLDASGIPRSVDGDGDGIPRADLGAYEWAPSRSVVLYGRAAVSHEGPAPFDDPGAWALDAGAGLVDVLSDGTVDATTLGPQPLTYPYTDSVSGLELAPATRVVTVVDTVAPTLTWLGDNPLPWPAGVAYVDPGVDVFDAMDAEPDLAATGIDVSLAGDQAYTVTATDDAGNVGAATRTVQVRLDDAAPVVTAPEAVAVEATGPATAVTLGAATATDAFDGPLDARPDATGPFAVGGYVVTWSAVDRSGNTGSATQDVTVSDTTPPVVVVHGDDPLVLGYLDTWEDPGATATDLVDGDVAVSATGVDSAVLGDVVVTYTAADTAGNEASATRTVSVQDVRAPVVTAPDDVTVEATGPTTDVDPGQASATDDHDGTVDVSVDGTGPFAVGAHTLTWSATDAAGNVGTATQDVVVEDTTAPSLTLSGSDVVLARGDAFTDPGATATDLVDGDLTDAIEVSGTVDVDASGTSTLTYTVADAAGNVATAERTVTVEGGCGCAHGTSGGGLLGLLSLMGLVWRRRAPTHTDLDAHDADPADVDAPPPLRPPSGTPAAPPRRRA